MTDQSHRGSRWRLARDVFVFQVRLAMEAVLDLTLIPVSLAAAGLDLVAGNWRQPRWFHAVLRFGERCERRIDLWGVAPAGPHAEIEAVMRGLGSLMRHPGTTPSKVRELRRWAALKLDPGRDVEPRPAGPDDRTEY